MMDLKSRVTCIGIFEIHNSHFSSPRPKSCFLLWSIHKNSSPCILGKEIRPILH